MTPHFRRRQYRPILLLSLLLATSSVAAGATDSKAEPLWSQNSPGVGNGKRPTLTAFLPDPQKRVGTAVVIYPGGGYARVATEDGHKFAKWLNTFGVAGVVVDYRAGIKHPAPLQDAQRAIRTVRARASEWNIVPNRIGVLGTSAGGHLAATTGTHFDKGNPKSADPIERVSCRPDFLILYGPVIAFGEPYTHHPSQTNLIGDHASPALVRSLSCEKQVTIETPPTFLWHTDQDTVVPSENSIQFYSALRRAKVPAELHIYRQGNHGYGVLPGEPDTTTCRLEPMREWMQVMGLLKIDKYRGSPL
jgi:acetyl esterase/lipase